MTPIWLALGLQPENTPSLCHDVSPSEKRFRIDRGGSDLPSGILRHNHAAEPSRPLVACRYTKPLPSAAALVNIMPATVALGTPLAEALSNVVQPKLVEMGWSSDGGDDSALTEYVILMLVNGKTQEQIAEELSNDLLNLEKGDTQAHDFARWLFEQVETLNRQINGQQAASGESQAPQPIPSTGGQEQGAPGHDAAQGDSQMSDAPSQPEAIPTGPRAMRQGQSGRGRLLNQINKNLDRSGDAPLHRIRNQGGMGRVQTHNRDFKGGRLGNQKMGYGRHMGRMGPGNMQGAAAGNFMQMSPQDQMQFMALLEEQARLMAQFMPGLVSPAVNPNFQQRGPNQNQGQGRSLFERVERQPGRPAASFAARAAQNGITVKDPNAPADHDGDMDTSADQPAQEGEQANGNTDTVCRFNLRCTKKECPYAHQSPAAPEGVLVDVTDKCPFGAACKNRKCTGSHPSPAVKAAHQAEEVCRFFPNCTNPNCPFKHPNMPLCRNGADCNVPGCKFTHLTTMCKYKPCLNRNCPYKHVEGQKGTYADKVWVADNKDKPHVSERKFVDDSVEEELIKPEAPTASLDRGLDTQEVST
ncbi:hypothetical protein VTN31DRAFT_79 [Thermomyces dupontii]|uniref:uncharacterized protein n=1 Tax=Talaromyces thermophilus TaxID=28565 RepID=UPI003743289B